MAKAVSKKQASGSASAPKTQDKEVSRNSVPDDNLPENEKTSWPPSVLKIDTVKKLLISGLREIYWAELHLTQALPKMIASATDGDLKQALTSHLSETETQVERLTDCLTSIGETPSPQKCDALEGLSMSGEQLIYSTPAGSSPRDIGIVMSGLKVENFEATAYNGLISLADSLGLSEVVAILQQNLAEELAAGELLETISTSLLEENNQQK